MGERAIGVHRIEKRGASGALISCLSARNWSAASPTPGRTLRLSAEAVHVVGNRSHTYSPGSFDPAEAEAIASP